MFHTDAYCDAHEAMNVTDDAERPAEKTRATYWQPTETMKKKLPKTYKFTFYVYFNITVVSICPSIFYKYFFFYFLVKLFRLVGSKKTKITNIAAVRLLPM